MAGVDPEPDRRAGAGGDEERRQNHENQTERSSGTHHGDAIRPRTKGAVRNPFVLSVSPVCTANRSSERLAIAAA
ncbi:hypothetical protein FO488_02285 [Geobacter sp. FeAm09]|uniref:hypothetical protein n=1 Tax=Geobacter sp. FeAm09 TaxID=2597769 RepID=UPI0011EC84CE|nr:hypothetical protein [Geobacter sp. FeAm09]QEM67103.1 hypothetical protein FO488_02285 [Geobacter sp. FeAm09]